MKEFIKEHYLKILTIIPVYFFIWVVLLPFWGTFRCGNWIEEKGEWKCSVVRPGLINPFYRFDVNKPTENQQYTINNLPTPTEKELKMYQEGFNQGIRSCEVSHERLDELQSRVPLEIK